MGGHSKALFSFSTAFFLVILSHFESDLVLGRCAFAPTQLLATDSSSAIGAVDRKIFKSRRSRNQAILPLNLELASDLDLGRTMVTSASKLTQGLRSLDDFSPLKICHKP